MREGLSRARLELLPGHGKLELGGGFNSRSGPFAFTEGAVRINQNQEAFLRGEWDRTEWRAVAGWGIHF